MGGIVTNPQGQALDAGDLKPIPGLYAPVKLAAVFTATAV